MMANPTLAAAALLVAVFLVQPATAQEMTAEQKQICAEAQARYKDLFGKLPSEEKVTVVLMYNMTFCPLRLQVKAGTTVRWVNVDKRTSHSVWFKDDGRPESDRKFPEEALEMPIDLPPGEHIYWCGPHGERENMRATITVVP
jgi:plastocyanin